MLRYLGFRLLQSIFVLFVILTITFFLTRAAPGGPFSQDRPIPKHVKEQAEKYYGLNDPLPVQWARWMGNFIFKGDMGPSFGNAGYSANEVIASALPVSAVIGLGGLLIAIAFGVSAGLIAAARKNSAIDYGAMSLALIGICLPTFVIGPALSNWVGLNLKWFNALGWDSPTDWVLPSLTLGLYYGAYIARLTRGGMVDILTQDFIRTAKAKGVPEWRILIVHGLKGGLLPVVNFLGPAIAHLITGSIVVETVFQIPGLGRQIVLAAQNRDYTLLMGTVAVVAVAILIMNLVVDVVQVLMNPKLRITAPESHA